MVYLHEDVEGKPRGNIFGSEFPDGLEGVEIDFEDMDFGVGVFFKQFLSNFLSGIHISHSHY